MYLVVESSCLVQVLKELGVSFPSPEVEVTDLKVAPDCINFMSAYIRI